MYHWSGHRKCGIGPLSPEEASKLKYKCPICGRTLTKGVESRIEELADRPRGFKPYNAIPYVSTLPLHELIALSHGLDPSYEGALSTKKVWETYRNLTSKLGSEYFILLEASREDILKITDNMKLVELITAQRTGSLRIKPGFDGVYGRLVFEAGEDVKMIKASKKLEDFL
ncbi:MAG: hypothetical protein QXU47_02030 [Candidatus Bathyarchaeia archaeon]